MKPENPYKDQTKIFSSKSHGVGLYEGWQEGFDAAVKWLNEICNEHDLSRPGVPDLYNLKYSIRFLCLECRKEIGL